MTDPPDFQSLFDALLRPAFILSAAGEILLENQAAIALFGSARGQSLVALEAEDPERLRRFLHRCSGVRQATIGKICLLGVGGKTRPLRCEGQLLRPRSESLCALVFLQCDDGNQRFSILAKQVQQLNAEMRKRSHVQAVLEESLRHRELLMRELQHRVHNNLQMISAMMAGARSESESAEAKAALSQAAGRIAAIAAVQQVLYSLSLTETVSADHVIGGLCKTIEKSGLNGSLLDLQIQPIQLRNDVAAPMALILNELLINAAKYGGGLIRVELSEADGEITLSVHDQGPGFDLQESRKRASGLGLVRGLARQIGGKFEIENRGGARCIVRMKKQSLPANAH